MTTQIGEGPLTVYLIDGGVSHRIPGIMDFTLVGESPETTEAENEDGPVNPRRARQMRRRRRANPGDLTMQLDYDPRDAQHQTLLAAGESDKRLTLRIVMYDAGDRPVYAQQAECSVLRYTLSSQKLQRRSSSDPNRPYSLEAELRLQAHGGFRPVALD